jgi:hypothetical protein
MGGVIKRSKVTSAHCASASRQVHRPGDVSRQATLEATGGRAQANRLPGAAAKKLLYGQKAF